MDALLLINGRLEDGVVSSFVRVSPYTVEQSVFTYSPLRLRDGFDRILPANEEKQTSLGVAPRLLIEKLVNGSYDGLFTVIELALSDEYISILEANEYVRAASNGLVHTR